MKKFITNTSEVVASGTPVITKNLADMQDGGVEQIENALTDLFTSGVIYTNSPIPFNITAPNNDGTFNVGQGVAYDSDGNRIEITSTDTTIFDDTLPSQTNPDGIGNQIPTPQSTGCMSIGGSITVGQTVWISISFLHVCNSGTPTNNPIGSPTNYSTHPVTGARLFYQWKSGYQINLFTNTQPTSGITLGSVTKNTSTSYTISLARQYLSVNPLINTTATGVTPNSISGGSYGAASMIMNNTITSNNMVEGVVFATGTRLPFYQATTPIGWTQVTNGVPGGSGLRVVTDGSGGTNGGSVDFATNLNHNHLIPGLSVPQLSIPTMGATIPSLTYTVPIPSMTSGAPSAVVDNFSQSGTGGAGNIYHTHTIPASTYTAPIPTMTATIPASTYLTGGGTTASGPLVVTGSSLGTFSYCNVIICQKN